MFFVCVFLLFIYLESFVIIPCDGKDQFIIRRTSTVRDYDLFIVPRSNCSTTCSALYSGATNHDPTQCKCACQYEYSTFGYFDGGWICLKNNKVREQPGCQFVFDGEHNYNPLRVLSTGIKYLIIFPSYYCTIDQSASRYRKCDGTWAAISVQSNTFRFLPLTENLGSGRYRYTMKVRTATSLAGRIVSLKVNCRNPPKSSCVLFKMAGQITCPVDIMRFSSTQSPSFTFTNQPTTQPVVSDTSTKNSSTEERGLEKEASNSGENGGSSGTVAAIVVIILLVVIVAAIIGFVIWKRRRGENILFMDHLMSIARKVRSPPPTKKPEEPEEQIYAEILEQPAQRQTAISHSAPAYAEICNYVFNEPNSAYAHPNKQNNTTSQKIPDEAPTDERGYMVPVDSPFYNGAQDNDQQNTDRNGKNKNPNKRNKREDHQRSTHGGRVESNDFAPFYDVLDLTDKQNTETNDKQSSVYNRQPNSPDRSGVGSRHLSYSAVPVTEGTAADNDKYVTKQRRRPPSPPRKIK